MKPITNDDLVLLYYGEHDDPALAGKVAASPELTARFDAIAADLATMDRYAPPALGDDYGADTWLKISPRLAVSQEKPAGFMASLRLALATPRFSFAGITAIAVVAVLAFLLGRQGIHPGAGLATDANPPQTAALELDPGRLLTASVSGHLEQLDIALTEFVNSDETAGWEAERATDMLVANRLYRQSAAARGDQKLAAFLASLEPLLIEMAYEAHRNSPETRGRMQQEVRDGLLFRVRAVNRHLQKSTLST